MILFFLAVLFICILLMIDSFGWAIISWFALMALGFYLSMLIKGDVSFGKGGRIFVCVSIFIIVLFGWIEIERKTAPSREWEKRMQYQKEERIKKEKEDSIEICSINDFIKENPDQSLKRLAFGDFYFGMSETEFEKQRKKTGNNLAVNGVELKISDSEFVYDKLAKVTLTTGLAYSKGVKLQRDDASTSAQFDIDHQHLNNYIYDHYRYDGKGSNPGYKNGYKRIELKITNDSYFKKIYLTVEDILLMSKKEEYNKQLSKTKDSIQEVERQKEEKIKEEKERIKALEHAKKVKPKEDNTKGL